VLVLLHLFPPKNWNFACPKTALIKPWENHPSGAEARFSSVFTARLKPCPFKTPALSELPQKMAKGLDPSRPFAKGPGNQPGLPEATTEQKQKKPRQ
jgi:hypothetical protein